MTTYVLLPSPLLGAQTWEPVAEHLRGRGARVVVASPGRVSDPAEVMAAYVAAVEPASDVVLVPHSNAGYFAPAVAARTGSLATVYVDAALPARAGRTALAPPEFLDFLGGLAGDDGLLPPWSTWWPDEADGLFPDEATRERIERDQPRLPLSYFRATVEPPAGWESAPQAYLAFGDTYAAERSRAEALGWPVRRLDGGHLHLLHDPTATAEAVTELREELRDQVRPPA